MSASMSHAAKAEPNLTPILDMVFQLITFFMLVINFKSASMDLTLKLPVVGSARPVESGEGIQLLILNINKEGELRVYGHAVPDIDKYIKGEATADLLKAKEKHPKIQAGEELPVVVVIRADRETPFAKLNRVISACQRNGYHQFALKAMSRNQEQ